MTVKQSETAPPVKPKSMTAIPLTELVKLSDDEIKARNPEEADKYIKFKASLLNESTPAEVKVEKPKPKRKCTEKQLAALAAGRAKNPRLINKKLKEQQEKSEEK